MKKLGLLLLISILYMPNVATAQKWSVEQQEVLDHLRACWDAFDAEVFDEWIEVCKPAENHLFWSTNSGSPQGVEFLRKVFESQWERGNIERLWVDIRPLEIQLHGDVALIYSYTLYSSMIDGEVRSAEEKRLETFRKVNGQWTIISGISVPAN